LDSEEVRSDSSHTFNLSTLVVAYATPLQYSIILSTDYIFLYTKSACEIVDDPASVTVESLSKNYGATILTPAVYKTFKIFSGSNYIKP
jgi:hypothetical protein